MVFVVGGRRSGTNWMQRILAAHPDAIAVPTEPNLFSTGLAPLQDRFQHGAVGAPVVGKLYMDRDAFLDALRDFCDAAFGGLLDVLAPNTRYLVERSPMDTDVLELIGDVYPDATIVHIIRDGRDVARSLVSQDWGPSSITEAAREWSNAVESAQRAGAALDHYHEVRYEQMLADPATRVPELYRAIGFDTSEDAVAKAVMEAGISYNADPRAPQLAEGKWRSSFSSEDLEAFLSVAGGTLAALGYDTELRGPAPEPASRATVPTTSDVAARPRRSLTGAVKRRVRGQRTPALSKKAFAAERLNQLRDASHVLDDALADLAARRFDAFAARISGPAPVRITGQGGEWRGRGEEGRAQLVTELSEDPALRGRQIRGDVYPALPLHTLVATYKTEDGCTHDRVLVLGIEGERFTTVTWHRFDPHLPT